MFLFILLDSLFCCVLGILVRYTFRIISMKRLTGCVINISDCHVLFIRTVNNMLNDIVMIMINILVTDYFFIRIIALNCRCLNVIKVLTWCPSIAWNFASYFINDYCSFKVQTIVNSWLSSLTITILVINRPFNIFIGIVNIFWIFRTLRIFWINWRIRCLWLLSCNGYDAML